MAHEALDRYLRLLVEQEGGTDLHLKVGSPARIRVKGTLETVPDEPALDKPAVEAMAGAVLTPGAKEQFLRDREAECTYSLQGLGRFRVSAYLQRGSIALIVSRVTTEARTLESLGLPNILERLTTVERGMVLVAAPAGGGCTTTLAALVEYINCTRACHVVTVEDPVEVLHRDNLASISQRQVGTDVPGVAHGVRSSLRRDPDVVVIGNVDALDVAEAACAAAEAGCLVLAGVRADDVCAAVAAVVALAPEADRPHLQLRLGGVLVGAAAVRLVPARTGTGRVPAVELLRVTPRIQAALVSDELDVVRAEMARGAALGMQTLGQSLAALLDAGVIDERAALAASPDWAALRVALEQRGVV